MYGRDISRLTASSGLPELLEQHVESAGACVDIDRMLFAPVRVQGGLSNLPMPETVMVHLPTTPARGVPAVRSAAVDQASSVQINHEWLGTSVVPRDMLAVTNTSLWSVMKKTDKN